MRQAFSHVREVRPEIVDGAHPVRSVLRLLGLHRWRMVGAVAAFAVKETPVWMLPVVTAQIIDIVVAGGPATSLWLWAGIALATLAQHYPNHVLYTKLFMGAVRSLGAGLRNALAHRLQQLSIGFHTRANSSIVQTKVVRDVENVEVMLQQVTHPLLSATMVLIGAIVMTAIEVPQFLPVYALAIPLAVLLRAILMRRSRERNELFRREVEHFSARVGEMASLMPITRAHGLEHVATDRVAAGAEGVRTAGYRLDLLNGRFASLSWVTLQLLGVACLVLAAYLAISGLLPISPERRDRPRRGHLPLPRRGCTRRPADIGPRPRRAHPLDRPGRDGCLRRTIGLGQVHSAEPRAGFRATHRRPRAHRRR
ncbi:ABC transporter-like protein [Microcella alkaliphila]|uniref:ABC transporter-like protein n=1 Tax=Microcella alkaliphila TaxID=279828 RepID=A0A0U5BGJ0_9MICO|nr:ABC transporter-like protein [Microcella alkaliphila]